MNTLPEPTLNAFADHGDASHTITREDEAEAEATPRRPRARRASTSRRSRTNCSSTASTRSRRTSWRCLRCIDEALTAIRSGSARIEGNLGPIEAATSEGARPPRAREDVAARLQAGDHTLWADDPAGIADRLGWLTAPEEFAGRVEEIEAFARGAVAEGLDDVVLLGMGGSSLVAEVVAGTHGSAPGHPGLTVLDTTDPAEIRALDARLDLSRTLFVVASKSGTTLETRSQLDYFWSRVPDGARFVAITDPGTPLAEIAGERGFRQVFLNSPEIGGRYSRQLSYFGLVPAALLGVDLRGLLAPAVELQRACGACAPPADNPGVRLGAVLGAAAGAGRDKLTLVLPPPLAAIGAWIEQLVAESIGKDGRGIVPVEGEPLGPPEVYSEDRLFVAYGDHEGLAALEQAGHPVARLPLADANGLGAEFYRWEVATAVAGLPARRAALRRAQRPAGEGRDRTHPRQQRACRGALDSERRRAACGPAAGRLHRAAGVPAAQRGQRRGAAGRARAPPRPLRRRPRRPALARASCTRPASCTRAARTAPSASRSCAARTPTSRSPAATPASASCSGRRRSATSSRCTRSVAVSRA